LSASVSPTPKSRWPRTAKTGARIPAILFSGLSSSTCASYRAKALLTMVNWAARHWLAKANHLRPRLEHELERENLERLQIEMNDAIVDGERFLVAFEQTCQPRLPHR
jgi:hypothetical protein